MEQPQGAQFAQSEFMRLLDEAAPRQAIRAILFCLINLL
jgi:hypothetical protein